MNTQKVEIKQREHLVSLVQEARNREKQELEEKNGATKEAVIAKVIESEGLAPSVRKIESLSAEIKKLEAAVAEIDALLGDSGFERYRGEVILRGYGVPAATEKLVSERLASARRPIEKSLKRYDIALAGIWTAASSDELAKSIEGVL